MLTEIENFSVKMAISFVEERAGLCRVGLCRNSAIRPVRLYRSKPNTTNKSDKMVKSSSSSFIRVGLLTPTQLVLRKRQKFVD